MTPLLTDKRLACALVLIACWSLSVAGVLVVAPSNFEDSEEHASSALSSPPALSVCLSAQDFEDPVADAGENFTAYVNAVTVLNGSGSTDNVAVVNFFWTFTDDDPVYLTGENVSYVFTSPGTYNITLNVSDAEGNWDTDNVTVTVEFDSTPPVVNMGRGNTTVYLDYPLFLSASRSSDPETGISNYTWIITYGSSSTLLYGRDVRYEFSSTGTYIVTLNVTNGVGLSNETSISVESINRPSWLSQHWLGLSIAGLIALGVFLYALYKKHRDKVLLTSAEREKLALRYRETLKMWKTFRSNILGFSGFVMLLAFLVMALFAPVLVTVQEPKDPAMYEPESLTQDNPAPPSWDPSDITGLRHIFGTDNIGRDVYSMTIFGARASLLVGFAATFISMVLGASVGLISGFFGKWTDEVLMRFTDYFLVLPWFPLMIVLMTVLGHDFIWVIVVIGITSWPSTARVVRAQVLTVKERTFIERARCVGAREGYIIRKHIFPNVLPLIFANTILLISNAIFSEAFLDFFGLGDPDVISWGTMLEDAYNGGAFDSGAWWWTVPPSLAIILCVLSFSLVGYALDDIFNPRLRKR